MKSILRCKAHHQGDRCKKARHHDLSVQAEPDKVHVGNFTAFEESGTASRIVARFEKKAPKRSRVANRMYRDLKDVKPGDVQPGMMKVVIFQLEQLAKHFKGRTA